MNATALATAMLLFAADETRIPKVKKLNVAVVDAHGQPVTDLRSQDVQVFEDGKAKQIAYFQFTGARTAKPAPGPGEVSNRGGLVRQTTVVLVDMLSDRVMSDAVIGREVGEALKKLESADDVYLYFLTNRGEVVPVHALPDDGDEQTPSAVAWTQNATPLIEGTVKRFFGLRTVDDLDPSVRYRLTATALDSLGGAMQRIPGRKNLVWVSHGAPLTYRALNSSQLVDLSAPIQLLAERLEQAQIVVYPVQQSMQGADEQLLTQGEQTLDIFARFTGGRMNRTDRVDLAITQARTDSRSNYQVAYYSATADDKKRHKLRLTCARKDLRLQTEPEYFAFGLEEPVAEFERRVFSETVQGATDATEIGLTAGLKETEINIRVDGEDLLLRQEQGHYVGNVSVVFALYAGNEEAQATRPVPLHIDLNAKQYEEHQEIELRQTLPMSTTVRKVRAIVVDGDRRAVGSVTIQR